MAQRTDIRTGSAEGNRLSAEPVTKMLKLLVIGASRGTGRQVMQQALAAGHAVVALARDPARIDIPNDVPAQQLSVVRGDVLDPSSLAPAMADRDAVISTLGVTSRAPTTLYSEGMRNIIQAMRATGVRRLVAVSAAPLSSDDGDTLPSRLLLKPLLWALFRPVYADMATMEDEIRQSGLDWTILRPPRLTDKPPTGRYRTALNRSVRGGRTISRADLAAAILKLLDDPTSIRAAIGIAY
jgi:putative NADH-flavin reductase